VKVYIADKNTTTNAGGLYTFNDVPVTSTSGVANSPILSQVLSVTIAAPAGYLGATVTVTPSAQIDNAEDKNAGGTQGGVETFIDGYLAQAGTAVLPQLNASVTGTLRDANTGAVLPNTKINLDLTTGGTVGVAQEGVQNAAIGTTYAVSNYSATTDANGIFSFTNIPSDSAFTAVAPGYNPLSCFAFNTNAEDALELGTCNTTKIVSIDAVPPQIASVAGSIASIPLPAASKTGNTAANVLMLEDDTRQVITINLTEEIAALSEVDNDFTKSITVYDWTNKAYVDLSAAGAVVISGNMLTVTLPNALTDAQELDINMLITDFKDAAGNKIVITDGNLDNIDDALNYVANNSGQNQAIRVSLIAYNDLNTNASAVTAQAQQAKDSVGISADGFDAQRTYSNAFNDVSLPTNNIAQLNADESTPRLNALSAAQNIGALVTNNSARFTFTPSGASSYNITMVNKAGVPQNIALDANRVGVTAAPVLSANGAALTGTASLVTDTAVTPVELVLTTATIGDIITITPIDDFGYVGTSKTITLVDNVAPTTVLQESYMNARAVSVAAGAVKTFGDGGELTNNFGQSAGAGTPILAVTPGLLDNLDAAGNNILSDNTFVTGDQTLERELSVYNGKNAAGVRVIKTANVYDATAYAEFVKNLSRNIGVAFSEDVNLTGVTPSFDGTTVTATSYVAHNDVTVDDAGDPAAGSAVGNEAGLGNNVDLVEFTTTNVLDLANNNHGKTMSFNGIKDNSGNVADNAKVVFQDNMPPFITKSTYNGDLTVVFNEAITTPTNAVPVTITVANAAGTKSSNLTLTTANQLTGTTTNWSLSTDKKTLSINSGLIAAAPIAGGAPADTLRTLFDAGSYVEAAASGDTVSRQHALVSFDNVQDTASGKTNSWAEWSALADLGDAKVDLATPIFAAIDMIGEFKFDTTATKFKIGTALNTTQEVVWNFTHPIKADTTGASVAGLVFFDTDNAGISISGTTNIITATSAAIANAWSLATSYTETMGAAAAFGPAAYAGSSLNGANTQMTLSSDRKSVTLSFRSTNAGNVLAGNTLSFKGVTGTQTAFTSALTNDEVLSVTATAKN
jgi:hypothetical protein